MALNTECSCSCIIKVAGSDSIHLLEERNTEKSVLVAVFGGLRYIDHGVLLLLLNMFHSCLYMSLGLNGCLQLLESLLVFGGFTFLFCSLVL